MIVATRVERTHEVLAVEPVLVGYPVRHRLIDQLGRVAVVGGLLDLELLHKLLVLLILLADLTCCHALLKLLALSLDGFLIVLAYPQVFWV